MQENPASIFSEIENKIFNIRGMPVMLDSDLAMIYGVETKRINEAVKRNIDRFPHWFMFQITASEWEELKYRIGFSEAYSGINEGSRSQFVTLKENNTASGNFLRSQFATLKEKQGKHRKFLPHAFTEQGVAMLSAVLKSETAVKISIQIMSAFVALRKIHLNSAGLYQRMEIVEKKQIEADGHFNKIFSALLPRFVSSRNAIEMIFFGS